MQKAQNNDQTENLDKDGLNAEIEKWVYPLHFIDFETAMPAIPLNKGSHPYQPIAFQFSHHVLHQNGKVEHVDQFINNEIGVNPNINFVRALMRSLSGDKGTIFRYHSHENTYLNFIYQEISNSKDYIEDREPLLDFIKSITQSSSDSIEKWVGNRCMVDLCYLVQRYYYDPATNGSTSIKKVFPAILNRSAFLRDKYSKPIYGATDGINSLNFYDMQWLQTKNEKVIDPYQLLPPLFTDIDIIDKDIDLLFPDAEIKGGGAASIAYLRMQFSTMTPVEREALTKALLKYCELDTLAMVMIVEAWLDMLGQT